MAATCDIPREINVKADLTNTKVVFIAWTEATARTLDPSHVALEQVQGPLNKSKNP